MAPHLAVINRVLLQLVRRKIHRAILNLPPRHGKSTLVSHHFPAWYLGHFPEDRVMLASYEADFAASWGRKARDVMTEWGERLFDVRVSAASNSANRWDLAGYAGGMNTSGVGGAFTGKGANLLIIEDPIKNAEQSRSDAFRRSMWDWWESTAYTRLEPNGICVVIQTRWHEDDLAGRLIQQMADGGEPWEIVNLPAIAEADEDWGFWQRAKGDPLWGARYGLDELSRIQRNTSDYWWSALYQQRPIPEGGAGMFERAWFPIVDEAPADIRQVRFWDMAATEPKPGSDPDWTVGIRMGLRDGIYWVYDVVRVQKQPAYTEELQKQIASQDDVRVRIGQEQEPGSAGKTVIDHARRRTFAGYAFEGIPATGSKSLRAMPASSAAKAGNIRLVRGPWNREFLGELERFPLGKHDDQVDAFSGAFEMLAAPVRSRKAYTA